jgi:formylmethanofuran dehydrogenase subunit C
VAYYLVRPVVRTLGKRDIKFPAGYDLVPDADRNWLWLNRKPATRAILWTRDAIVDPRLTLLADDKSEIASRATKTALEGLAKDREFADGMTFADMVADLFVRPGAYRQGMGLVSDKRAQRYKLLLGPDLDFWSALDPVKRSSTVTYTDNFTTNGSMDGRSFSGGTASWTRSDGTLWATASGLSTLTNISAGTFHRVYTSHDTDGADVFTQFDVTTFNATGNSYLAWELHALANAAASRMTGLTCEQQVGTGAFATRSIWEWDDPDYVALASDSSSTNTGTFRIEVSGTTVTAFRNGTQILTGGPHGLSTGAGNRRGAMAAFSDGNSTNDLAFDNFSYGDIGAISGSANFTLGTLTSTATGTVSIDGAADITLGALTSTATGTVRVQGAADFTLGALTTLATGTVSNAGAADITLGALTSTATGAVLVQGAADITLGALTADAEGEVAAANDGEADITLGDLVVTATGQVVVTGSVDAVLGALTVEASSSGDASSKPIRRRKKYLYIPPEELTPAEVKQLYREARQEIPVRVQGGLLTLAPDLFRNRSERELPALSRLSITKLRQEIDLLRSLQAELADIEHTRALKAEQDYEAALRRQVKKDFEDEDDAIIFAISELGP